MKQLIVLLSLLTISAQAHMTFEDGEEVRFFDSAKRNTSVVVEDDCSIAKFDKERISYGSMIEKLGGVVNSPSDYENSLQGFQEFLEQSGAIHFSAKELGITDNIKKANELGFETLIPPKGCWLRGVALTLLGEKLRSEINSPVVISSWYRPDRYNKFIGGSRISDHLQAKAMDMTFRGPKSRAKAQKYLCKNFWKDDYFGLQAWTEKQDEKLNITVGLGGSYMHIGLGSLPGRGWWTYSSLFRSKKTKTSCWKY
jgi:hypothetical protein